MNKIKLSLVAALLAGTTTLSADFASDVELSANVALTSNYVFRGMTQTANSPAVQGGFDASYKGAYVGVWASSFDGDSFGVEASSEFDIYIGYANEIAGLTYDVNYCQYMYPSSNDESAFGEASLTLGYDFKVVAVSAKYYMGVDTHDEANDAANGWEPGDGWEVGVSVPLPMDISLDGTYGDFDDSGTQNNPTNNFGDYYSIGASKTFGKFDVTLAYTGMDYDVNTNGHEGNGDEDNIVLTVGTSF